MTAACPACAAAPIAEMAAVGGGQQYSLPTIHCAACIGKIERGLSAVTGVQDARVNLSRKRLSVTGSVGADAVLATVEGLGYEIYPLDAAVLGQARDSAARNLLTRMAVAGFAMMNVMLLSVAVWSGATDATRDLFHLISAAIAVPVVAYSGQPFFGNAWTALRVGRLNMDVPISLAILLATGMSLFESLSGGEHAYFDAALSLTFFLLIGRYMDFQTRSAARSAAKELAALEVNTAQRIDAAGRVQIVPSAEITVGDQILVPSGGRVPVDGALITDAGLMDRSFLTGESEAVSVAEGATLQAGEVNLAAPITLQATAVGEDTTLRRMAMMVETAENGRNSYTALADRAAQIYAPAVHLLALFAFLGWVWATGDIRHSLNIAIAVLIITCPCALGLAVPAVTTTAISRLFGAGFLVKHATALERLAEVDHAVFDKTGTLTQPAIDVPAGLDKMAKSVALALAQMSNHPMSRALSLALAGFDPAELTDIQEVAGQGVEATWKSTRVRLGRGAWLGADFAGLGLKIGDQITRIESPEVLREGVREGLSHLDLPCEVLTGDAEGPALALAAKTGLTVTHDIRPEGKLAHLEALTAQGHRVLMVGDGLNDTAALAAAHASIAPARALEASRSAADVIILNDSMAQMPLVLRIARGARRLSKQNFAIAAVYNLIAIPIALAGFATPLAAALAMSLSSITVILNSQRLRGLS